jgi:hypothetical protein
MSVTLVPRKRGRQPVPGKEAVHREIAGLVYYTRQSNEEHVKRFGSAGRTASRINASLNYARNSVAQDLGIHVATVRRAWRAHKRTAAAVAKKLGADFEISYRSRFTSMIDRNLDPWKKHIDKLKTQMQEIRESRGIPRLRRQ